MKLRRRYILFPLILVIILVWWALTPTTLHMPLILPTPTPAPPVLLPHDPTAFTQGLVWVDGWLYEGTGLYGESSLRKVNPETGEVVAQVNLAPEFFGEGLAEVDGRLIWLTWREETAFVYDLALNLLETIPYEGEGWGLCYDGTFLVMSNGTAELTVREVDTLAIVATLPVTRAGEPVWALNELECVGDFVYANVWRSAEIMKIDRGTGEVTAVIDTTDWLTAEQQAAVAGSAENVLNGLAYNPTTGDFYVTGKRWPWMWWVHLE